MQQIALVTGGASGLGAGVSCLLTSKGYKVAIVDLNAELGEALASEIGGVFYQCDVSSDERWANTVDQIVADLGVPNKVFLNAGIMTRPPQSTVMDNIFDWIGDGAYEKVMGINVDGVLYGLKHLFPLMKKNGGGDITVTSSLAGLTGLPFDPIYSMSKHAVVGLVRSFAPILEGNKITINAFCPGGMVTPIVPKEIKALSENFMSIEEAAVSLLEVSNKESTGAVWVRNDRNVPLEEYVVPPTTLSE